MSRGPASLEAILGLASEDTVGRLVRRHFDPALALLDERDAGRRRSTPDSVAAVATSALLALRFLASHPDTAVYRLLVGAVGVDEQGGRGGGELEQGFARRGPGRMGWWGRWS